VHELIGTNVPQAYAEMLWFMKIHGREEQSRNGKVTTLPRPAELSILLPKERVLFDPDRDANPFFHVMEFVWMMSGSKDLKWISQFNKGFGQYSDDKETLPASYGFRWRNHFGFDQLDRIVRHLRNDPASRRAVLGMWDPRVDLSEDGRAGLDRPCNTSVHLRILDGRLDFTVINRSNDAVWGMLGANAVHMTMLHELLATEIGVPVGTYRAYTTNLHVYERHMSLVESRNPPYDPYKEEKVEPYPLLQEGETMGDFLLDAENFVGAEYHDLRTHWFNHVAYSIKAAYLNKDERESHIASIEASDWRLACSQWSARRKNG
jgi:thymidylate synthase